MYKFDKRVIIWKQNVSRMQKVCWSVYIYLQVVIFDSRTSRAEFPKPKEVGRFKEMEKSTWDIHSKETTKTSTTCFRERSAAFRAARSLKHQAVDVFSLQLKHQCFFDFFKNPISGFFLISFESVQLSLQLSRFDAREVARSCVCLAFTFCSSDCFQFCFAKHINCLSDWIYAHLKASLYIEYNFWSKSDNQLF